jgi:hypothetical protein
MIKVYYHKASGRFNYDKPRLWPEKLPHSVPKGPLGLVQGKVFSGKLNLSLKPFKINKKKENIAHKCPYAIFKMTLFH